MLDRVYGGNQRTQASTTTLRGIISGMKLVTEDLFDRLSTFKEI